MLVWIYENFYVVSIIQTDLQLDTSSQVEDHDVFDYVCDKRYD